MKPMIWVAILFCAFAFSLSACEDPQRAADARAKQLRDRAWEEPCHDASRLLATTSGSPDDFECPNKHHRMRVTVATKATNEEAAALVFCECEREAKP